ncbi:MAG: carbon storage regulator [Sedimenticolaceae bacterium]
MLILGRGLGETIRVGDDIEVTLVDIRGSQICIGVEAYRDVDIKREELLERDTEDA